MSSPLDRDGCSPSFLPGIGRFRAAEQQQNSAAGLGLQSSVPNRRLVDGPNGRQRGARCENRSTREAWPRHDADGRGQKVLGAWTRRPTIAVLEKVMAKDLSAQPYASAMRGEAGKWATTCSRSRKPLRFSRGKRQCRIVRRDGPLRFAGQTPLYTRIDRTVAVTPW